MTIKKGEVVAAKNKITRGQIISTGTEYMCPHCNRWVTSNASIHGPCPVGRRDDKVRGAKVRHVLQLWEGGKMLEILPVSLAMFAVTELLEACKALQMEAASRGCGLRIADEAIAKAQWGK